MPVLRQSHDVPEDRGRADGKPLSPRGAFPAEKRLRQGGRGLRIHPRRQQRGPGSLLGTRPLALRHRIRRGPRHARTHPHLPPRAVRIHPRRRRLPERPEVRARRRPRHLRTRGEPHRRNPEGHPQHLRAGEAVRRLHLLQGDDRRRHAHEGLRSGAGHLLSARESGPEGLFLAHHARGQARPAVRALHLRRAEPVRSASISRRCG